jgi:hypothetical protein
MPCGFAADGEGVVPGVGVLRWRRPRLLSQQAWPAAGGDCQGLDAAARYGFNEALSLSFSYKETENLYWGLVF